MHRADLTKLSAISEAHYTDLYGNAVRRFHEKYKDADGAVFYVNFNPVVSDPRDKTILGQQSDYAKKAEKKFQKGEFSSEDANHVSFKSPASAHSDPVGTYAYPIDYVTKHWYDIEYGRDMSNLRVLKAKTTGDKVLRLTNMSQTYFVEVMKKLNLEFSVKGDGRYATRNESDAMMIYEAIFDLDAPSSPHFRINSYGKTIFRLLQSDFTFFVSTPKEEEEEDTEADTAYSSQGTFKYEGYLKVKKEKPLSAQKQNERARAAGFDAILDRAESTLEASIHPNEPEQIIFLTKRSYDVADVFKMPNINDEEKQIHPSSIEKLTKVVSGNIAAALGDRIAVVLGNFPIQNLTSFRHWLATERFENLPAPQADPTMREGRDVHYFITVKGRLIVIDPISTRIKADQDSVQKAHDSVDKVRVRPGEDRESIRDNLRSYQESKENPYHRAASNHNATAFRIGVVGEYPEPVFLLSNLEDTAEDIAQKVREKSAKNVRVVNQKSMSSADLSAKPHFRRITKDDLVLFRKAKLGQQATATRRRDQEVAAKLDAAPSTKQPAPDGSAEHQEP